MDTSKDGIKAWLAKYPERDRVWLADKCGVERKTVDNWLSSPREIPSKAILIIEDLMGADLQTARPDDVEDVVSMPVRVSGQQYDNYTRAFKRSDSETFREWLVDALDKAARDDVAEPVMLKVAENPDEAYTPPEIQEPGARYAGGKGN
jgi:hypothetical protein